MSLTSHLPDRPDAATVTEWADRYAHFVALLALVVSIGWTPVQGWQRFVDGGQVLFRSNDAWYHYRTVRYTVEQFPRTMPFDPRTAYPTGTDVGQFVLGPGQRSDVRGDGQDPGTDQYTVILERTGRCRPAETLPLR